MFYNDQHAKLRLMIVDGYLYTQLALMFVLSLHNTEVSCTAFVSPQLDMAADLIDEPSLLVFLLICGAGMAVLLGYAIFHFFFDQHDEINRFNIRDEQGIYMRRLRLRNMNDLARQLGRPSLMQDYTGDAGSFQRRSGTD
nr:hypothetical protein CFP56_09824 [Quercus suber]